MSENLSVEERINKFKRDIEYIAIPNWTSLSSLGKAKVFKSSYLWVVVVPIIAKLFKGIEDIVSINAFGVQWSLTIGLPFSWKIFYFASFSIGLGMIVYALRSPEMIRKFNNYSEFLNDGKTPYQVREYFIKHINSEKFGYDLKYRVVLFLQEFTKAGTLSQDVINKWSTNKDLVGVVFKYQVETSKAIDAFWFTQDAFNTSNVYSRNLCLILFSFGSILFSYVLFENFIYVFQSISDGFVKSLTCQIFSLLQIR
jgi:hypothetical protein